MPSSAFCPLFLRFTAAASSSSSFAFFSSSSFFLSFFIGFYGKALNAFKVSTDFI
jgi:hypothetical protein